MSTSAPQPAADNRTLVETHKELATASTGLIGNLEVLRRLSGKQFQSYTTALVATVAVGCFLLVLNVLIFAGIYHQREKRARDNKTKEELQDSDTSKNSSMLKLNTVGIMSAAGDGQHYGSSGSGMGKTTVVFGEYSCYDEKTLHPKDEKLLVDMPPQTAQMIDTNNWACSTSTLDLLKTKHHHTPVDITSIAAVTIPSITQQSELHLHNLNSMEMNTFNTLSPPTVHTDTTIALQGKRGSFGGGGSTSGAIQQQQHLNQFDYSVQSSDQMSFKEIEDAVKASTSEVADIVRVINMDAICGGVMDIDDDIPEPPPPPKSFQNNQQQQHGGILRQAGSNSISSSSGKKRVHIQEISV